ncbi:MAG: 5-formyltetrahydrofolate cyclo-ligase [Erythrobacter sp.]
MNKSDLRTFLRQERREHVAAQSPAIRALLFNRPPAALAARIAPDVVIGLYHASQYEAPTQGYAQFFLETGHDIALPHFSDGEAAMTFRRHVDPLGETDLEPGPFDIAQSSEDAAELVPDVIFVPLLGFTAEGGRIGQGGGHYDRWMAAHPEARAIGLAWDVQLLDTLPLEPHDRLLHTIVTPTRIYEVG